MAEKYHLLPTTQHGCHRQCDTLTALELLTEQIHTVWNQGTSARLKVASLLSLDMSSTFPNISHDRLLHNLQCKGVPTALIRWTASFLADRKTTLVLGRWQSPTYRVSTSILQGFPITPILFLFFNTDLVEHCTWSTHQVIGLGFVDNVNILACRDSTEENCHLLKKVHNDCLA